ncbi:MAG: DUF4230 domain-containing protein [Verrucomicrobia bacterium]|nr:DUF4230 domain-containing protein [Verrucomicrobiota bacterium]
MQRLRPILAGLLLAAVCLALGLGLGLGLPRWLGFKSSQRFYDTPTLLRQVQTLAQLVTVKYVMEKTVVLEDVKWSETFGTSRVLMVAHGVVKAGVDLGQLAAGDVRVAGKRITVVLPPARITDAYLDEKETQVVERTTGLLRSFDKSLEQTARQQALEDIQRAARRGGILKDADAKAKEQLANLFHQLGFERVEFRERGFGFLPRE